MRYSFISFGIIVMLLASCRKPATELQRSIKPVTKISSSATDFRSFTYDANKLLTNHTIQFNNGNGISVMSVNYSYVDEVISTALSPNGSVFYETEVQQVRVVRSFRPTGGEISVVHYSYNSKGQLIEWIERFSQPGNDQPKESKQAFEYYADGNVKQMKYYLKMTVNGDFVLNGTILYDQYDHFKNPEISFFGTVYLPSVVFQKNNPGRIRYYGANAELYQTSTFEYTYDADGYPVTKLFKDDRSSIDILFRYHY